MNKKIELDLLRNEVACCTKCPELVANRTQTVFGNGNPEANLMIIGEAAGKTEDERGECFVGESGELLNNIIKACGWERKDLFITNVLKCRPPNNRNPTDEESRNCRSFLDRQIDIVQPKFLLLLGSTASKAILGGCVSSLRGNWYEYKGISTICTWHPSYLLRKPEAKRETGKDLRMLIERMKL